jgi:hypothetical protein
MSEFMGVVGEQISPETSEEEIRVEPLPVHVISSESEAPEWGTWQTFSWAAATPVNIAAQRILPLDRKRHKAQVIVYNGTGAGAGAFILIGSRNQIYNAQGGQLQAGRYPIENSQELWITSDGVNAMTITVLQERYN